MFLETLLIWEAAAEMTAAISCFVLNIYFTWRFANLSTINRNLRAILVFEHLMAAILTLVHPILVRIPPHVYSIKEGRYWGAALVYPLFFFVQTLIYLLVSKFLLIALERSYAFNNRQSYENSNSSIAWRMIKIAVSCGCFCVQNSSQNMCLYSVVQNILRQSQSFSIVEVLLSTSAFSKSCFKRRRRANSQN